MTIGDQFQTGRPVVLRNGIVLTMDDGHRVLRNADVLVQGERIAEVGPNLTVPDATTEIDASGISRLDSSTALLREKIN